VSPFLRFLCCHPVYHWFGLSVLDRTLTTPLLEVYLTLFRYSRVGGYPDSLPVDLYLNSRKKIIPSPEEDCNYRD